jgi:hypothetical protein
MTFYPSYYHCNIVLVIINKTTKIKKRRVLYKCTWVLPGWTHRYPFDHRSQATFGLASTWKGDPKEYAKPCWKLYPHLEDWVLVGRRIPLSERLRKLVTHILFLGINALNKTVPKGHEHVLLMLSAWQRRCRHGPWKTLLTLLELSWLKYNPRDFQMKTQCSMGTNLLVIYSKLNNCIPKWL